MEMQRVSEEYGSSDVLHGSRGRTGSRRIGQSRIDRDARTDHAHAELYG